MPVTGVVAVISASHILLSLAALCVCMVAAEVMTRKLKPLVQIHRRPLELNGCYVIGQPAAALTQ
jgi:hypothetical protein